LTRRVAFSGKKKKKTDHRDVPVKGGKKLKVIGLRSVNKKRRKVYSNLVPTVSCREARKDIADVMRTAENWYKQKLHETSKGRAQEPEKEVLRPTRKSPTRIEKKESVEPKICRQVKRGSRWRTKTKKCKEKDTISKPQTPRGKGNIKPRKEQK